ncbi:MAG: hypothetical protein JWP81_3621 [Ferruginibacter sp.]|nr:hypothetical protein [Ferruginibacter sp.]
MLQYKRLYQLLLLIAVTSIFAIAGCKKDNSAGAPSIRRIRAITPDSMVTAALPGQIVVIQGTNLSSTTQISFNGFPASFNSGLFSDSNLVVRVPRIAWDSIPAGKLNTVDVVTLNGTVTYKFDIIPPVPTITSLSNEMALPGSTLVINGSSFYGTKQIIFPGNIVVTNFTVSGITKITVTVPAGITQGGPLKVVGTYGTGTSVLLFNDFTTGMLTTFDDGNYSWGSYEITNNATLFPGSIGKYSHIVSPAINAGDWSWWDGKKSMNTNSATWVPTARLDDPLSSYALKFEMSLKVPWTGSNFYIVKDGNWTYLARFEPWKGRSAGFVTAGWTTITIPLTDFKTKANGTDGTGVPASSLKALVGDGKGALDLMLINAEATAAPAFDGAFDNFRVVKIQ